MRQVVVTGVGVCVPGCSEPQQLFSQLAQGQSFINFDEKMAALGVRNVATCAVSKDEIATLHSLYPAVAAELSVSGTMAFHALTHAVKSSGIDVPLLAKRCGLFYGVHKSLISPELLFNLWQGYNETLQQLKVAPLSEAEFRQFRPDHVLPVFAREIGLHGQVQAVADACAAGATNILSGLRRIRAGRLDVAICGAADEGSQPLWNLVFRHLGALSSPDTTASTMCRPFDRDRSGTVLADGAAFLILEEESHARLRGAPVLARISGGSRSSESYKMTSTAPDGSLYLQSMQAALSDAGLIAAQIDHVNAHGTGTKSNDSAEGLAIRDLFGAHCPVTSTKGALGHSLSGSGAIEAVLSVLSLRQQQLLPTLNYQCPGPQEAELNIVRQSRPQQLTHILSNSFGFGGQNASLVISKA